MFHQALNFFGTNQKNNSYRWNLDGSVTVSFANDFDEESINWTVHADGRIKLHTDIFRGSSVKKINTGLGFELNSNKLRAIKWIGNGPASNARNLESRFGFWSVNFVSDDSHAEDEIYRLKSGSGLCAMLLDFDSLGVIIRSDTRGTLFELLRSDYLEGDMTSNSIEFGRQNNFQHSDRLNFTQIIDEPIQEYDQKELILWFDFK